MKKVVYILIVLLIVISIAAIVICVELAKEDIPNLLLIEPNVYIREELLKLTPLGSSSDEVLEVIRHEEWLSTGIIYDFGYLISSSTEGYSTGERVGEKSVLATIGKYKKSHDFYTTTVSVAWGFNKDSKLIEIIVSKESNF